MWKGHGLNREEQSEAIAILKARHACGLDLGEGSGDRREKCNMYFGETMDRCYGLFGSDCVCVCEWGRIGEAMGKTMNFLHRREDVDAADGGKGWEEHVHVWSNKSTTLLDILYLRWCLDI